MEPHGLWTGLPWSCRSQGLSSRRRVSVDWASVSGGARLNDVPRMSLGKLLSLRPCFSYLLNVGPGGWGWVVRYRVGSPLALLFSYLILGTFSACSLCLPLWKRSVREVSGKTWGLKLNKVCLWGMEESRSRDYGTLQIDGRRPEVLWNLRQGRWWVSVHWFWVLDCFQAVAWSFSSSCSPW